jgi:isoleucyl-tRNA synthetase
MSKSLGNIISPYEVVDKYSSDIFRFYICGISAGENISFNWEDVKQKQRGLMVLMNIGNYIKDLLQQEKLGKIENIKADIEERYILSRANSTINKITELFENYEIDSTISEIEKLILDLSRVYIKLTRDKSNEDKTRRIVLLTIYNVYIKCLKMLSVICPLVSEDLWQKLKQTTNLEESVHLSSWPKADKKLINKKLEKEFEIGLEIIEKGLAERDKAKIGLKWPLAKAIVNTKISKDLQKIVANQLNVKQIEMKSGKTSKEIIVKLDTKMTSELESEGYARVISRQVQALRKKAGLVKTDVIKLGIIADESFAKIIERQGEMIKQRTNAKDIVVGDIKENDYSNSSEEKVKEKEFKILLKKI